MERCRCRARQDVLSASDQVFSKGLWCAGFEAKSPLGDEEIFWDCMYCEGEHGLPRASTNSPRCTASQCKAAQTAERAAARTALPVVAPCAPKAEPTTCFKIKEVLGVSMCTEKMTDEESRCGRARSDEEICYQLRGKFGKSRDEDVDDMVLGHQVGQVG